MKTINRVARSVTYEREVTVYKGEEIVCTGTINECAKTLGVKPRTVHYYTTNTHKKRVKNGTVAVFIDEMGE